MTKEQNLELNKIKTFIKISLFGSNNIPEATLYFFHKNKKLMKTIKSYKSLLLWMMKKNGMIKRNLLISFIKLSTYKDIIFYINIPKKDFYLSDYIVPLIKKLMPGIETFN